MIRQLTMTVLTAAGRTGDAFIAELPERFRSRRIGSSYGFRFAPDEVPAARDLWRRITAAGLTHGVTGQTKWTAADGGQGRLCVLSPPIGPAVNERDIIERRPCPVCGTARYRLVETPRIEFDSPPGPAPAVCTTESGLLTFVSAAAWDELAADGLLTGAVTVPVGDEPYFLLASDIDLGMPAGPQYRRRCPECDAPLAGATYFPMFRRPATAGHVCFLRALGPGGLVVSEEFARAAGRLAGDPADAPLAFIGWYPDDTELAVVPDLDQTKGALTDD